jgi:hypothetical protein
MVGQAAGSTAMMRVFLPFLMFSPTNGEGDAREIRSAAHHVVGVSSRQFHLFDGFLPDDRLVQHDVIEDRTERVVGVITLSGHFDRLADGDAEAAR